MPKKASEFKIIGKPQNKYGIEKFVQGSYPYPMDLFKSNEYLPSVVALAPRTVPRWSRSTTRPPRP